jgi:hypothetical protein
MNTRSDGINSLKLDMNRLRKLAISSNNDLPNLSNRPSKQMPSLERTSPPALVINDSMETTETRDHEEAPEVQPEDVRNASSPVNEMVNLFNPSDSPKLSLVSELRISTSEERQEENETEYQEGANDTSPEDNSFDPFREIVKMLTPRSASEKETQPETAQEEISLPIPPASEEENAEQENNATTPSNDYNPLQEIVNMLTPRSANEREPEEEENEVEGRLPSPTADVFKQITSFFSPAPSNEANQRNEERAPPTPDHLLQAWPARLEESPKRPRYEETESTVVDAPAPREVATFSELCRDAGRGMAQLAASAQEISAKEWLLMIQTIDVKKIAATTRIATKRTFEMVADSAKEIDPKQLLENAKNSTKSVAVAIRSNAQVHPVPWVVIGGVTSAILLHELVFNRTTAEQIVERVSEVMTVEMGDEAQAVIDKVRSSMTCPATSADEILLRVAKALRDLEKPSLLERLATIAQNPRTLLSMIINAWKSGKMNLAEEEAFTFAL